MSAPASARPRRIFSKDEQEFGARVFDWDPDKGPNPNFVTLSADELRVLRGLISFEVPGITVPMKEVILRNGETQNIMMRLSILEDGRGSLCHDGSNAAQIWIVKARSIAKGIEHFEGPKLRLIKASNPARFRELVIEGNPEADSIKGNPNIVELTSKEFTTFCRLAEASNEFTGAPLTARREDDTIAFTTKRTRTADIIYYDGSDSVRELLEQTKRQTRESAVFIDTKSVQEFIAAANWINEDGASPNVVEMEGRAFRLLLAKVQLRDVVSQEGYSVVPYIDHERITMVIDSKGDGTGTVYHDGSDYVKKLLARNQTQSHDNVAGYKR